MPSLLPTRCRPLVSGLVCAVLGCGTSGVEVSGVVSLTGLTSVREVSVTLTGQSTSTATPDEHGAYTFRGLRPGHYAVTVLARSTLEERQLVVVQATGTKVEVPTLTFTPVGSVTGTVVLEGAANNGGALVTSASGTSVAFSDEAGRFELTDVPLGQVRLLVSKAGFLSAESPELAVGYDDQTNLAPLRLLPRPAGVDGGIELATVRGTAHLVGETDHAGIDVALIGGGVRLDTQTLDGGAFEFARLQPGFYSLSFNKGRFHEDLPQVLATPGASALLVDRQLRPLPNVRLLSGRRLQSCREDCTEVAHTGRWGPFVTAQAESFSREGTLEALSTVGESRELLGIRDLKALEISADGKQVLVADSTGLKLVGLTGDAGVTSLSTASVSQAHFLADAGAIVSVELAAPKTFLRVVSREGDTLNQTSTSTDLLEFGSSTDGQWVLFSELDAQNHSTLKVLPSQGGPVVELAQTPGYFYAARLSNDGTRVYFMDADGLSAPKSIKVVPRTGGPARVLVTGMFEVFAGSSWADFSNDVTRMLYLQRDASTQQVELHVLDLMTGKDTRLSSGSSRPAHFSPDGTVVAYQDDDGLHALRGQTLTTLLTWSVSDFSISPDNSRALIITSTPETSLVVVPLAGGTPIRLTEAWSQYVINTASQSSPWLDAHHVFAVDRSPLRSLPQLYLLEVP